MVKIQVTWHPTAPTAEELTTIQEKMQRFQNEGKTNGEATWLQQDQEKKIIEREWVDVEAAEEFLAFIKDFSPISAQIVS
jgi:hypothetical protein